MGHFSSTNLKMMWQSTCDLLVRHHLSENMLSFPVPLKEQSLNNTTTILTVIKLQPYTILTRVKSPNVSSSHQLLLSDSAL